MNQNEELYQNLTGVDINKQKHLWDERGKGYYGEYCVFKELLNNIPGCAKFLMNLNVPVQEGKTTEIDLLMVHETGIYVFEVKHYKGTIYGDENGRIWTQYFRTSSNNTFNNPVAQNNYHIFALAKLFPEMPIHSVIVFSNPECDLRVNISSPRILVTRLDTLCEDLSKKFLSVHDCLFDIKRIDEVFNNLKIYSPLTEITVQDSNDTIIPFNNYLSNIRIDVQNKINDLQSQEELLKKGYKTKIITHSIALLVVILLSIAISVFICTKYIEYETNEMSIKIDIAEKEMQEAIDTLEEMKQKFKQVNPVKDSYSKWIAEYIGISGIKLEMSKDHPNVALFTCKIKNSSSQYGLQLTKDTSYIIHFTDGTINEYPMFGERLKYSSDQRIEAKSTASLVVLEILNIDNIENIEYIKINNISIYDKSGTIIKEKAEVELYAHP
ncbi:MAG: NERD domain-containing protein [Clostridia bacterium]|nr:NERD domain-containing protein [Clostridia bacterium]